MDKQNIWLDGIMGVAVGDALGVPISSTDRKILKKNPVTEMLGYCAFYIPPGSWSDDTSMTLATLDSLRNGYNLHDIMKRFVRWLKEAEYTPFGRTFDVGNICQRGISRYQRTQDVKNCGGDKEDENGNGSLMRIMPMCLYAYLKQKEEGLSDAEAIKYIHEVSALTHAHIRSLIACGFYFFIVKSILDHKLSLKECLQLGIDRGFQFYEGNRDSAKELNHYKRIRNLEKFSIIPETEIESSAYVVDSLEASLWCLVNTGTYRTCTLRAVNLGDDTDTVAAIAGGLAGLYYGYSNIPKEWLDTLQKREWIEMICKDMERR